MPAYLPARRGIQQSEAYAEAISYAKEDPALLTLAFYHPAFVDDFGAATALYVVCDYRNLLATIEAGAPLHAGQEVEFIACPFRAVLPEESATNRLPQITLEIDNATRQITPYLRLAAASQVPVTMIARTYLASDTSAPHELPPLEVTLMSAETTATTVRAGAGFGDMLNVPFPRIRYTAAEFPGLVQ